MKAPGVPESIVAPTVSGDFKTTAIPSLEAAGGGDVSTRETQSLQQFGQEAIARQEKQKAEADQVRVQAATLDLLKTKDELQATISTMRGADATKAPALVNETYTKKVSDITKTLSNQSQQSAFRAAAVQNEKDLNSAVKHHLTTEALELDNKTTFSLIDNFQNDAIKNYAIPGKIDKAKQDITKTVIEFNQRNGYAPDSALSQKAVRDSLSVMNAGVVTSMLADGKATEAQKYLKAHKDDIDAQRFPTLEKEVEHGSIIESGVEAWDKYRNMRLADGSPDESKIRGAIFAHKDWTDTKKEGVWNFVQGRAAEDIRQKAQRDGATERSFMNSLVTGMKRKDANGNPMPVPLEDALRQVPKYAKDPYDQAVKEEAVRQMYAPPSKSDPQAYMGLWENVQKGTASTGDIDTAMKAKQINVEDWKSLRQDLFRITDSGSTPGTKETWARIRTLAESNLGNKEDINNFLYVMHKDGAGKTDEELWKIANDKFQGDKNTGFFGMFKAQQWKTDLDRQDAQNLAWGKIYEDIGKQEATAIGRGALYQGKPKWGITDLNDFATQLGGYDAIKKGTPTNNAIQSLTRHGELVTPANVKAVLAAYKDGVY